MFYRVGLFAAGSALPAAVGVATVSPSSSLAWIAPAMPVVIGVIMVILSRAILDMKAKRKERWKYNALVMTLCSIFTAVWVHEWTLTAGQATLFGLGVGASGVGIIKFGKPLVALMMQKGADTLK